MNNLYKSINEGFSNLFFKFCSVVRFLISVGLMFSPRSFTGSV